MEHLKGSWVDTVLAQKYLTRPEMLKREISKLEEVLCSLLPLSDIRTAKKMLCQSITYTFGVGGGIFITVYESMAAKQVYHW